MFNIGFKENEISGDKAINAVLKLSKPRLEKLLINMAKCPGVRDDYVAFRDELNYFCTIILFITENGDFDNQKLLIKADKYEILKRQFKVYESANFPDKINQLIKLCNVAYDHLGMKVPKYVVEQIADRTAYNTNFPF